MFPNDKWVLCYYSYKGEVFTTYETRDELMDVISEHVEAGTILNDLMIFPPRTSITIKDLVTGYIPENLQKYLK